jgi:riboflavin synthase
MFTGIIETLGTIRDIRKNGSNLDFCITSDISKELKIDQSVSHNGVCLTVTNQTPEYHWVTAVEETLLKTTLSSLKTGSFINLERCLKIGDRLDGHWVQGHVDTRVEVIHISVLDGSWMYQFSYPNESKYLLVPKGSVCINGVSLTVVEVTDEYFSVTIIPYTFENTQFKSLLVGDQVNIEWDILGKYLWNFYSKK